MTNRQIITAQSGMTLLELVVVLAVLAVMAVVILSRDSVVNYDAYGDGELLKSSIRVTRTRAMADIVPWSFEVAGQVGTFRRNGVVMSTVAFTTVGVAAGTTTFDTRGAPAGTMSYVVAGYSDSPVTVTAQTGFVP